MRLVDLYCGVGGAGVGYYRAGFDEIVGVDIMPQPNYPLEFRQSDALTFLSEHGSEFDFAHASPPCQGNSVLSATTGRYYKDWIVPTRNMLVEMGIPHIIENVPGAMLIDPVMLCGTQFGLGAYCHDGYRELRRHRLFESTVPLITNGGCKHQFSVIGVYGEGSGFSTGGAYQGDFYERRKALGMIWGTRKELTQAIPPAYTEFLGKQVLEWLKCRDR